jgi:hypothetical protein
MDINNVRMGDVIHLLAYIILYDTGESMKCKHNYQQLLGKNGKPVTEDGMYSWSKKVHIVFCIKCGERREV